ncbi:hypothetical protein [Streptomyces sp. NPDC020298]|uniref:hypothetical protein n=1 Tax=Streptomyces sp. NPDC020298 TaxID=3155010 RepID=UPI0033E7A549
MHLPGGRGAEHVRDTLLHAFVKDLSIYSAEYVAYVAAGLNDRPRKILGRRTPAGLFTELVATLE